VLTVHDCEFFFCVLVELLLIGFGRNTRQKLLITLLTVLVGVGCEFRRCRRLFFFIPGG